MDEQILVYLRISEDRTGAEAGVERQREDCLGLCARLGVADPLVFVDNDTSAYKNKKRPGYTELLEHVKRGPVRIVAWHVDRLYRRPRELEDLIDLVEAHPIRIETVTGGLFDLNTHEGRLMARQLVAIASYESGHKADRIRRANEQKAKRGDWHGPPRFGYGLGGVLIPEEAKIIREMADRFLAGHSLRSIAVWLNDESGMPSPRAGKGTHGVWYPTTVRTILSSARISGQRAYDPGTSSDSAGGRRILGPGNWEAIITPEETERIRAMFAHPDRRASKSSLNLLSAIATCGRCGAGLVAGRHKGTDVPGKRFYYRCLAVPGLPERGGLTVAGPALEGLVSEAVITRLSATTFPDNQPGADPHVTSALQAITAAKQRIDDMARDYGAGLLSRTEFHTAREAANAAVAGAERVLGRTNTASALTGVPLGDGPALREAWGVWSIPQKRAILHTLIDTLVIHPTIGGNGPKFRPERVELTFKA